MEHNYAVMFFVFFIEDKVFYLWINTMFMQLTPSFLKASQHMLMQEG